jgi:hypothetical protein
VYVHLPWDQALNAASPWDCGGRTRIVCILWRSHLLVNHPPWTRTEFLLLCNAIFCITCIIIYINPNTYTYARTQRDKGTRTHAHVQAQVQLHFSSIFHKSCNQYFICYTKVQKQACKFAISDLWISMACDHLSLFVSCKRNKFFLGEGLSERCFFNKQCKHMPSSRPL